ncbi:unnamed protein product, partial [Prorocentrum cordatum]
VELCSVWLLQFCCEGIQSNPNVGAAFPPWVSQPGQGKWANGPAEFTGEAAKVVDRPKHKHAPTAEQQAPRLEMSDAQLTAASMVLDQWANGLPQFKGDAAKAVDRPKHKQALIAEQQAPRLQTSDAQFTAASTTPPPQRRLPT